MVKTKYISVIYKHVVARKIRLTKRFSFILFIIINKRMEYLSWLTGGYLVGGKWLLWSGLTVLSSDALSNGCEYVTSVWPIYIFPISNTGSRKYYLWKENDWLKNRPFFITENFLGILNRVCVEPMHRSHDFLSLTSSRCFLLQQCWCLLVCVLCVLVVRCVKC